MIVLYSIDLILVLLDLPYYWSPLYLINAIRDIEKIQIEVKVRKV